MTSQMIYCAFTSEYGSCALCVNVSTARVKSVCRKPLNIALHETTLHYCAQILHAKCKEKMISKVAV